MHLLPPLPLPQTVSKMQMLDKDSAQLDWRMVGSMGALGVDIGVSSIIKMNALTGRIISHT